MVEIVSLVNIQLCGQTIRGVSVVWRRLPTVSGHRFRWIVRALIGKGKSAANDVSTTYLAAFPAVATAYLMFLSIKWRAIRVGSW
jgi:hypothetical protein